MARRLRTTNLKDWERRLASLKNNKPLMKQLRAISGEELILVWNQKLGKTLGRQAGCLENCQAVKTAYPESEIVCGWIVVCKETTSGFAHRDEGVVWRNPPSWQNIIDFGGFRLCSHFNIKRLFRGESEPRVSNVTPWSSDYHIFLPDSKHHKNPQILESVVYHGKDTVVRSQERHGFRTQKIPHPLAGKIAVEVRSLYGRQEFYTEDLRFMYAHPNHCYTDEQCKGFPNANKRRVFRNRAHIQAQVYGSTERQVEYFQKIFLEYGFKKSEVHRVFQLFFPELF